MNKRDVERAIKAKLQIQVTLIGREPEPKRPALPAPIKKLVNALKVQDKALNRARNRTEKIKDELHDAGYQLDSYRSRDHEPLGWYLTGANNEWMEAQQQRQQAIREISDIELPLMMANITLAGEDHLPDLLTDLIARIEAI